MTTKMECQWCGHEFNEWSYDSTLPDGTKVRTDGDCRQCFSSNSIETALRSFYESNTIRPVLFDEVVKITSSKMEIVTDTNFEGTSLDEEAYAKQIMRFIDINRPLLKWKTNDNNEYDLLYTERKLRFHVICMCFLAQRNTRWFKLNVSLEFLKDDDSESEAEEEDPVAST
jgi:hypothetical protein